MRKALPFIVVLASVGLWLVPEVPATAQTALPVLRASQTGDEPPEQVVPPDGKLATPISGAPADGDLSAEGKAPPASIAADATPQAEPAPPSEPKPVPRRRARATAAAPSARTVAGRPSTVPEADSVPAVPVADPAADETTVPDASDGSADAQDAPPDPETTLRPAVAEADDNPYAPVGIRLGSFVLKPNLTAETEVSDNVLLSRAHPSSDIALVLRPGFTLESDWSRHFVSLDVRGLTSTHRHTSSEDDRQFDANLRGRLDVTEHTSLEGEAGYDYGQLSRSDPNVPIGATARASTRTATLGAAVTERINRLSLRLHGALAETDRGDTGAGADKFRDLTLDSHAGYEWSPSLTVFGAAKRTARHFADANDRDGIKNEFRMGLETDRSEKLSAAVSLGGAQIRPSSSGALAMGWVGDANVVWLPSALTTVTFAAGTNVDLTDASGATALRTSSASLDLKHEFRRWLALLAGISDTQRSYAGLALTETELSGHAGLEYDLNPTWALTGDVRRTSVASSDPARGYAEDKVMVGVKVQR